MIPEIAIISPTSDQRLCIIITITSSLLCSFDLGIKTGKHHKFSLIGMSICSFVIFIFELIYKLKGNNFGNFILVYLLVVCRLIFISFIDVTEKYLIEYNFMNQFDVLSFEGLFGVILCFIYSFVTSSNPFNSISKVYSGLEIENKILMIIFLILYFILSAGINIYVVICNVVYTPMAKSLPGYILNPLFIIYYFIYENDFVSAGERNIFYFVINIILSLIIDFFALIYNEFLILNCFELQSETHYGITKRAINHSLTELEELEDIEKPDIDNSFDY